MYAPYAAPGPLWRVDASKFNGQAHYTLPAAFVADDGTRLWLRTPVGAEMRHFTRGASWTLRRPSDLIFWRDRWYNVYVNYDEAWRIDHFYCNVGLPPQIEDGRVAFVDLDLDVQIWPDGRYAVLDEDEYIEHARLFGYPADVQAAARRAVEDVLALWRGRAAPFDWLGLPA